jgi:putative sporulation protein YyaC
MKKISFDSGLRNAESLLTSYLLSVLRKQSVPVIVCIGSDRVTGDCLGPLTGHFLTTRYNVPAFVYGTLDSTVTAKNLVSTIGFISARHPRSKILVVDASIGPLETVGCITAGKGGILPGSGCGKNLPLTGDFSITAVVTHDSENAQIMLQNTKLSFVYQMSELIAKSINDSVRVLRSLIIPEIAV